MIRPSLSEDVDEKFEGLEDKIEGVNNKIDTATLDSRNDMRAGFDRVDRQIAILNNRADALNGRIDTLNSRVDRVYARVDTLDNHIVALSTDLTPETVAEIEVGIEDIEPASAVSVSAPPVPVSVDIAAPDVDVALEGNWEIVPAVPNDEANMEEGWLLVPENSTESLE